MQYRPGTIIIYVNNFDVDRRFDAPDEEKGGGGAEEANKTKNVLRKSWDSEGGKAG